MRKRTLIAIFIFTGLVLLSRWVLDNKTEPTTTSTANARSLIDYQLDQFEIKDFGPEGRLLYTLSAPKMSRHALTEETSILRPKLIWPQQTQKQKIILKAESGKITGDLGIISLRGNVIVKSRTGTQQTAIIRTESLDFYQEDRMISTEDKVAIETPGAKLKALGMTAQLEDNILLLEQQVSGQYETQQ